MNESAAYRASSCQGPVLPRGKPGPGRLRRWWRHGQSPGSSAAAIVAAPASAAPCPVAPVVGHGAVRSRRAGQGTFAAEHRVRHPAGEPEQECRRPARCERRRAARQFPTGRRPHPGRDHRLPGRTGGQAGHRQQRRERLSVRAAHAHRHGQPVGGRGRDAVRLAQAIRLPDRRQEQLRRERQQRQRLQRADHHHAERQRRGRRRRHRRPRRPRC